MAVKLLQISVLEVREKAISALVMKLDGLAWVLLLSTNDRVAIREEMEL